MQDSKFHSSDSGFALITVLWTMLILAAITVGLSYAAKARIAEVRALVALQQQRLMADGLASTLAEQWAWQRQAFLGRLGLKPDGVPVACELGGFPVELSMTSAFGLVDLNTAPPALLERLLAASGLELRQSRRVAAAIIDFRDGDDVVVPNGSEAPEYKAVGRLEGPKNAPFETVAELAQVLGVDEGTYQKLRRWVTVFSRAAFIDPSFAPADLKKALDELGPSATDSYSHGAEASRIVRITASVGYPRAVTRQAVVENRPQAGQRYELLEWISYREGMRKMPVGLSPCF